MVTREGKKALPQGVRRAGDCFVQPVHQYGWPQALRTPLLEPQQPFTGLEPSFHNQNHFSLEACLYLKRLSESGLYLDPEFCSKRVGWFDFLARMLRSKCRLTLLSREMGLHGHGELES